MSDDEGGEDYGDYEDAAFDDGRSEAPDEGPLAEEVEEVVDEDAVGTDEDEEAGEEETEVEEEFRTAKEPTESGEGRLASRGAAAQRPRVDPILRASNRPRPVRIVHPDDRVTDTRLQLAEAAMVLATRAQQIAKHATSFTDAAGLHDPVAIAQKELYDRRCPLRLRRVVGVGEGGEQLVEEFNVREMTLPPLAAVLEVVASVAGAASAASAAPAAGVVQQKRS
jgi:DNA-directed RNA polymerase I, II, and III subunit RPABC2